MAILTFARIPVFAFAFEPALRLDSDASTLRELPRGPMGRPNRTDRDVYSMKSFRAPALGIALSSSLLGSILATALAVTPARSEAFILVDVDSGKVLRAENATYPWYPASTTKLMTLYMTLSAIRDKRITLDTLFTVSRNAVAQAPTKMGFPLGTQVTVDNALKMMMVKSANDMAVLLAEGIGGSIDDFAVEMTNTAHRLGMTESNYVNPNGLPADGQITSARDLAILARALIREFPEYSFYWHIPAIKYGRRVVRNYNPLLGRYPGADGMKTGFICASGFNLVATATRDNRRLIAVVLGAPSGAARAVKAAEMLEGGFTQNPLAWLMPSLGSVDALAPIDAAPPNLKDEMCGRHRKRPAAEDEDEDAANDSGDNAQAESSPQFSFLLSALRAPTPKNANLLSDAGPVIPTVVYTGPTRTQAEVARLATLAPEPAGKKKAKHKLADAKAVDGKVTDGKAKNSKTAGKTSALAASQAGTTAAAGTPAAKKPKAHPTVPSTPAQ
jgi:D-alanyl-D-alanine carboxypeptidase